MSDSLSTLLADVAEIRYGVLRLSRRLLGERPADGLSTAKLSVLAHLYLHGPATPGHLAVTEHYMPQSLTRVLAELETDGLVARRRGERDRRQSVLAITEAGRRALEPVLTDVQDASGVAGSTPTFLVMVGGVGNMLTGNQSSEAMIKAIEAFAED